MSGLCMQAVTATLSSAMGKFVRRLSVKLVHLRTAMGLSTSHHHSSPRNAAEASPSESDDAHNTRTAEYLGRRLRSQDHHVIDDRMLVPCALRGLQLIGRLNLSVAALNRSLDSAILSLVDALRTSGGSCLLQSFSRRLEEGGDDLVELRALLSLYSRGAPPPQLNLTSAGKRLRGVAGNLLIDLCSLQSTKLLQYFSDEPVWSDGADAPHGTEGTLPQPIITQVSTVSDCIASNMH